MISPVVARVQIDRNNFKKKLSMPIILIDLIEAKKILSIMGPFMKNVRGLLTLPQYRHLYGTALLKLGAVQNPRAP